MNSNGQDTIAAIATARGPGGIGIVRLSGDEAVSVAARVFFPSTGRPWSWSPVHRRADHGRVLDPRNGQVLDEALALFMAGPRSFTGQDVVELQVHGGAAAPGAVLDAVLLAGARLAEPGEFTRRAFLNGRMDLSAAEAVMEMVSARTRAAALSAAARGAGEMERAARSFLALLSQAAAQVEAALDFPEDVEEAEGGPLAAWLRERVEVPLARVVERSVRREALEEELTVAIVGLPNVGKSSLLNLLAGEDRAIVSEVPGTTRDVVQAAVNLSGLRFVLADTAGFRDTADPVESQGVARSLAMLDRARVALVVTEAFRDLAPKERDLLRLAGQRPVVLAVNKADLLAPGEEGGPGPGGGWTRVLTSARTGQGLEALVTALVLAADAPEVQDALLEGPAANLRQRAALEEALEETRQAARRLEEGASDLAAEHLRESRRALGRVTGETVEPHVLDEIFSRFCVGK
ncbi:MAG: tRNA uridine-5-carboxymethylaminomethyl(34) synthesis GTPase MnmE [Proteobacteria bacterium]|nr:tRNA uridine-5-carboxymethylaminomethyl(34) synthesis GTPase MnmE [Pseudomonadota bacterium]